MSWCPDSKVYGMEDRKDLEQGGMMAAGETAIQEQARKTGTHQHLDVIVAQSAELAYKEDVVQLSPQAYPQRLRAYP